MRWIAALVLLLRAARAAAGPAEIMAALPDRDSACRYGRSLAAEAVVASWTSTRAARKYNGVLRRAIHRRRLGFPNDQRIDDYKARSHVATARAAALNVVLNEAYRVLQARFGDDVVCK